MFGIGGFELFLIILFGFLIFGPDKLPEVAKTVGMAINKFKKAKEEMDGVIREEVFDPTAEEPFKNPTKALDRAHSVAKEKVSRADHEETFAERKARYDRERAEMKKRSEIDQKKQAQIDANRAKMKEEAAKKVQAQAQQAAEAGRPAAGGSVVSKSTDKRPTADELYGNVPMNKEFVRSGKPAAGGKPVSNGDSAARGGSAENASVSQSARTKPAPSPRGGDE